MVLDDVAKRVIDCNASGCIGFVFVALKGQTVQDDPLLNDTPWHNARKKVGRLHARVHNPARHRPTFAYRRGAPRGSQGAAQPQDQGYHEPLKRAELAVLIHGANALTKTQE